MSRVFVSPSEVVCSACLMEAGKFANWWTAQANEKKKWLDGRRWCATGQSRLMIHEVREPGRVHVELRGEWEPCFKTWVMMVVAEREIQQMTSVGNVLILGFRSSGKAQFRLLTPAQVAKPTA